MKVLVTGSDGFIGSLCLKAVRRQGDRPYEFDLPCSVLDRADLASRKAPKAAIHLAAHKHAPYGEDNPAEVAELNILGTRNVVERFGSQVVLASTCKAADPMTAYGASKLIAERIVLNAGGRVVRLVNVWGSSGSVADVWFQLPKSEPLPVTDCMRMWMSPDDAVSLLVRALRWPSGRYGPSGCAPMAMSDMASVICGDREQRPIPLRRGDRPVERLVAEYEVVEPWRPDTVRIVHPADLPVASVAGVRAA